MFAWHRIIIDARTGVTLIELMVVILIMLMVSAMTMTAAAPALEARKVREAARIVEVAFSRARNRALQNRRPAGIWIERATAMNLSEASTSLAYCEVPDIYGGDFPNSGVSVIVEHFSNSGTPYGDSGDGNDYGAAPGPEELVAVVVPHLINPALYRRDTSLDGNGSSSQGQRPLMALDPWYTADPKIQQVIRSGDQIQFNLSGPRFTLESSDNHPRKYIADQLRNRYGGPVWYYARAVRALKDDGSYSKNSRFYYEHAWFHNGAPEVDTNAYNGPFFRNTRRSLGSPEKTTPAFFTKMPVRYRIFRQPIKSADAPINLPEGAVIDLNFSGTRRLNFHPRLNPAYVQPNVNVAADDRVIGVPPNPYTGNVWISGTRPTQIFPAQFPADQTPIILTFTESGLVDRIFARQWKPYNIRQSGEAGSWEWTVDRLSEPMYLLVGRREKVPAPVGTNAFESQVNSNWADSRNVWITINNQTGFVGSSQNAEVPHDVVINGLKGHTPNVAGGNWNVNYARVFPPHNNYFQSMSSQARADGCIDGLSHMGYGARRIAMQQLQLGGK